MSLIELSRQRVLSENALLLSSFAELNASTNNILNNHEPIMIPALQSIILSHNFRVTQLAKSFIILDKSQRMAQEQPDVTEEQAAFLNSLIEFHCGYTRVWDHETKYNSLLLDYLNVLNQTIQYYEHQSQTSDGGNEILNDLYPLWQRAKLLYPNETSMFYH